MSILTGFLPMLILKGTLLLMAGFGAGRILSRAPAAARHLVWLATLAGLAALPVASATVPAVDLALLPAAPAPRPDPAPSGTGAQLTGRPAPDGAGSRTSGPAVRRPAGPGGSTPGEFHAQVPPGSAPPAGILAGFGAGGVLLAAYVAGAALVLATLGLGLLRVGQMRRRAEPLHESPSWRSLLSTLDVPRRVGVGLYRSREVEVPFTWGFLRPAILLPWESGRWSRERRRNTLIHELSHVERRDWLTQLSARLICALYWFHPLVWIASRRLVLEAERTCDDRVLASGTRSHDYAQHLLELAARMRASRVRLEGAVAMARRRQLPVRIEAILDDNLMRSSMSMKKKLLIGLLSMAPALLLAPAHLTQARAEQARASEEGARKERLSMEDRKADRRVGIGNDAGVMKNGARSGKAGTATGIGQPEEGSSGGGRDAASTVGIGHAPGGTTGGSGAEAGRSPAGVRRGLPGGRNAAAGRGEDSGNDAEDAWEDGAEEREEWGADSSSGGSGHTDIDRHPGAIRRGAAWHGPTYVEPTDEMTPLMIAAARGDLETARLLVDRREGRADLDEGRPGLGTPLILAANNGHREIVRFLLDRGAGANRWETGHRRLNDLPRSALTAAARAGYEGIVELLLDRGARVDAAPENDATALMEAARRGHFGICTLLLNRGADVNLRVRGDGTPLIAAAEGGDVALAELLLDRGADPRKSSSGDGNPLIAAARSGNTGMVRLLLDRGADPDEWVDGDESGFFHALRQGDARMVEDMIDAGADVDARWPGDGSPLIVAAKRGDREIADALLRAGAGPDVGVDGDGNPLIQAARNGSVDLVARLVEDGADVNSSVEGDGSPLIAAARSGRLEVVTFLVNAGADVNMSVRGDENPLVGASEGGYLDVVEFLVARGADVNARFVEHGELRTPLSMALKHGHHDVADYLRSQGAR